MALIVSDARQNNGIHIDRIPISLNERPATKLEAEELTKQLNDLGLYCSETYGEKLKKNNVKGWVGEPDDFRSLQRRRKSLLGAVAG